MKVLQRWMTEVKIRAVDFVIGPFFISKYRQLPESREIHNKEYSNKKKNEHF